MGSNEYVDEQPIHTVKVKTFYLSKYEVTNAEYAAFLNAKGNQEEGGKKWLHIGNSQIEKRNDQFYAELGFEKHPVTEVSWYGAKAYCDWVGGRLPTEAEWEYAAGGGQGYRTKYAGTNDSDSLYIYVNFCDKNCIYIQADSTQNDDYKLTAPVGSYQPNPLGLYDMSGNVWEWCEDRWHLNYKDASS